MGYSSWSGKEYILGVCTFFVCFVFGGFFLSVYILTCSVALCYPRDCSAAGFPVLHNLLEFVQIHVH